MRVFSIIAVCLTNLLIGLRYVWLIRRDRISPALAMWVFFTIAVIGSLLTYLSEGDFGLLDNVLNSADRR
jgi:mannose/fructose/N-acetylgalactosamine-specific phosphotransferase system component IID